MNGFAERGLDEDAFGEKKSLTGGIRSFDAFREYPTFLRTSVESIKSNGSSA